MVGLFSIGLGPGRMALHAEDFAGTEVVRWLGGVVRRRHVNVTIIAYHCNVSCFGNAAMFL